MIKRYKRKYEWVDAIQVKEDNCIEVFNFIPHGHNPTLRKPAIGLRLDWDPRNAKCKEEIIRIGEWVTRSSDGNYRREDDAYFRTYYEEDPDGEEEEGEEAGGP